MKISVGDEFLVTGPTHFEKVTVTSIKKSKETGIKTYTLSNQLQVNKDLIIVGSKSHYKVEVFDQDKYNYLVAKAKAKTYGEQIVRLLNSSKLSKEALVKVVSKLGKILDKYNKHDKSALSMPDIKDEEGDNDE